MLHVALSAFQHFSIYLKILFLKTVQLPLFFSNGDCMMSTIIADGTISAITLAITSEIEICQYYSLLACPLQECKDESHLTF